MCRCPGGATPKKISKQVYLVSAQNCLSHLLVVLIGDLHRYCDTSFTGFTSYLQERCATRNPYIMRILLLRHRDLETAALLRFSSGHITVNTKVRFNTFCGLMTCNTVSLGMKLQAGKRELVSVYATGLTSFAFGTLCAPLMLRVGPTAQRLWLLRFCSAFLLIDGLSLIVRRHVPHGGEIYL